MGTVTVKGKFLPQYRTSAQWSAGDPVLLRGEIGIESDTRKFKFGDGTTSWSNLGYAEGAAVEQRVAEIETQIGNVAATLDAINGE